MKTTDYFKSTTFFYNNLFLKKVLDYNLTLNEFILFNYFINMHVNNLDLSQAERFTYLKSNMILDAYNGLISKGLINIITEKDGNGVINEIISFDNFIEEIDNDLFEKNKRNNINNLLNKFEEYTNKPIKEEEIEMINAWLDNNHTEEEILLAFSDAKYNGVFSLRYIDKLLNEKNNSKKNLDKNLFDYDWLSEE